MTWVAMSKATYDLAELKFAHTSADQCLVLFDQARCRGADLRLATNAHALVTLGEDTTKDAFMQAVGRLRKFGRSQTIRIAAQHAVVQRLGNDVTINGVLRWLITNTCVSLSRGLPVFVRAASHFAKKQSQLEGPPVEVPHGSKPSDLYSGGKSRMTIADLENLRDSDRAGRRALDLGAQHYFTTHGSVDQVAEREVMREVQRETEEEVETAVIHPLTEQFNKYLAFSAQLTSVAAMKTDLKLSKEIAVAFFVPNCLYQTPNFSAITKDVHAKPLRRVSTLIAMKDHMNEHIALWVSEFEAATVMRHWNFLKVRHFHPGAMGGLTVLHNYDGDPFPQFIAEAIVFTMLFNGQSMFEQAPSPTKTSWVPLNSRGGPVALNDIMQSLLKGGVSSEAGSTYLRRRNLETEYFRASDLERAIDRVCGRVQS
ncbi:Hypothetical protein, putative [Bodo saltans]|uniref:ubiquitinyl hydrolase 1 n=1 Tax=Bodo saltans TaxID=75058 RepID=A0A0S4IZM6_BODSA|nr:Hypothetical protein, putative [Bodo saltans]|eukprot:CUG26592.1 Hypothetical protein, putative [Bodo saltans]